MATTELELRSRYERLEAQLQELFRKTDDPVARMATTVAVLHHKMRFFFWTGFYRVVDGELIVGPYQGSLACQVLERDQGVCWAAVNTRAPVVVPDVHAFPGHITCDPRSQSEVAVPVRRPDGEIVGVLDVDSDKPAAFGAIDGEELLRIADMIYAR